MISNRALRNFKSFMQVHPINTRNNPLGAHDSAGLPHPGSRPLRLRDFEAGGRHDVLGAHDAKGVRSRADDAVPAEGALADLVAFLQINLPRNAVPKGTDLLKTLCEFAGIDHDDVDLNYNSDPLAGDRRQLARDEIRRPKAGAEARFAARYPEAARVRLL